MKLKSLTIASVCLLQFYGCSKQEQNFSKDEPLKGRTKSSATTMATAAIDGSVNYQTIKVLPIVRSRILTMLIK